MLQAYFCIGIRKRIVTAESNRFPHSGKVFILDHRVLSADRRDNSLNWSLSHHGTLKPIPTWSFQPRWKYFFFGSMFEDTSQKPCPKHRSRRCKCKNESANIKMEEMSSRRD